MRCVGTVKFFKSKEGWGMIKYHSQNNSDIFVHQTNIKMDGFRTLIEGQKVEFEIEAGKNDKLKAINVTALQND